MLAGQNVGEELEEYLLLWYVLATTYIFYKGGCASLWISYVDDDDDDDDDDFRATREEMLIGMLTHSTKERVLEKITLNIPSGNGPPHN